MEELLVSILTTSTMIGIGVIFFSPLYFVYKEHVKYRNKQKRLKYRATHKFRRKYTLADSY